MKGLLVTLQARRVVAASVLAGALATAGCGSLETDRAATVDGRVITESQVQTAQSQINETFPDANLTAADVLSRLVQAPVVLALAAEQGAPLSESVAEATYTGQPGYSGEEPATETLDLLRAELALQQLRSTGAQVPVEAFADLDVDVNPRYGQFDPQTASVTAVTPAWIEPFAPAQ